jgi:hypothetical protein
MPGQRQSVSDTVSWLSFPRQAYPNFYLNVERIGHRFRGYLGSIRDFSESVENSGKANAKVNAVFLDAGIEFGRGGGAEIAWDLADPLAQVLVLRAYLATVGELHTDAAEAHVTDFVLARGRGGLVQPVSGLTSDSPVWGGLPPYVVAEIEDERERLKSIKVGLFNVPGEILYWPTYAITESQYKLARNAFGGLTGHPSKWPVVSLLGAASLIGTDVRSYSGLDMTYCIFGQKVRDWRSWTLLSPLHVWVEPPGNANWG